jgi:hypothetical protein
MTSVPLGGIVVVVEVEVADVLEDVVGAVEVLDASASGLVSMVGSGVPRLNKAKATTPTRAPPASTTRTLKEVVDTRLTG